MCYYRCHIKRPQSVTIKLDAIVLTGGRDNHNPLLAGTSLKSKVLLPIGGTPMVASVIEAIAGSSFETRIHVSTNDPDVRTLQTSAPFAVLPGESSAVNSFLKSLERLENPEWVLFVCGDHPLLTSEMIDYYVEEAMERKLGFSAAVVNRSVVQKHYPGSRRTYFEVKGGAYSGGNMYLIDARAFKANSEFLHGIDQNRKAPWKSIKFLDIPTIIGFLFRQLDIHQVTGRASRLVGCQTGVVVMPWAEACMDVDKLSDKEIAEAILAKRAQDKPPVPITSILPQEAAS